MKIKIKRYTAVAAWRWNGVEDDDVCGICRRQYDATCPECKYPGEGCPLIFGECAHAFHNHCLNTWLAGSITTNGQRNTKCPMCRAEFTQRVTRSPERQTGEVNNDATGPSGAQQNQENAPSRPANRPNLRGGAPPRDGRSPQPLDESSDEPDTQMETT